MPKESDKSKEAAQAWREAEARYEKAELEMLRKWAGSQPPRNKKPVSEIRHTPCRQGDARVRSASPGPPIQNLACMEPVKQPIGGVT
jgi:hypothetical protein